MSRKRSTRAKKPKKYSEEDSDIEEKEEKEEEEEENAVENGKKNGKKTTTTTKSTKAKGKGKRAIGDEEEEFEEPTKKKSKKKGDESDGGADEEEDAESETNNYNNNNNNSKAKKGKAKTTKTTKATKENGKGKGKAKGKGKKKDEDEDEDGDEAYDDEEIESADTDEWIVVSKSMRNWGVQHLKLPVTVRGEKAYDANGVHLHFSEVQHDEKLFNTTYEKSSDDLELTVTVKLNLNYFQKAVARGKHFHTSDYQTLITFFRSRLPNGDVSLVPYTQPLTIPRATAPPKQPAQAKKKLYRYQLEALAWMRELEDKVARGEQWKFSTLVPLEFGDTRINIFYDTQKALLYLKPYQNAQISTKGGIYADEMGLGKTLVVASLIAANSAKYVPENEIAKETMEDEKTKFNSRGTLILAPNHLCKQWIQEMEDFKPPLKIHLITTKTQHEKCTYADFAKADAVVVSFQYLKNTAYTDMVGRLKNSPFSTRGQLIDLRLLELRRRSNPMKSTRPIFEHFNWRRVVVDEGHEILEDDTFLPDHQKKFYPMLLDHIPSLFRWYVTGTPVAQGIKNFAGALRFLQFDCSHAMNIKLEQSSYVNWTVHDIIRQNLFWRNTKASIGDEYSVPDVVEELLLLEMSDVERGIYNKASMARDELRMRQLCCHMKVSSADAAIIGPGKKTLDEVRVIMLAFQRSEIEKCVKRLDFLLELTQKAAKRAASAITADEKRRYKAEVTQLEGDQELERKAMTSAHASLNYFESILPQISQSTSDPCAVCLSDVERLTITPCAHLFCKLCIEQCVTATGKCPTCRRTLNHTQLTEVVDKIQKEEIEIKHVLQTMISKYGTKMAHLMQYLLDLFETDDEARVIIFSQWDQMLHEIGDTLTENGISNVYCKGNVHVKNKAISIFKGLRKAKPTKKKSDKEDDDEVRVMMLSLENAASGTNLTEASHIILIDPVSGTAQHARDIEAQAIGRAHRQGQKKQLTVVRLIVKDTVEHELYKRNSSAGATNAPRTNNLATIMAANPTLTRRDSELLLAHNDSFTSLGNDSDEEVIPVASSSNINSKMIIDLDG